MENNSEIIKELEKIKAEIIEHYCKSCWIDVHMCKQRYHCENCKGFEEIIDKHISEQKA